MSAGVRESASREFEGLEIEHDAKQISFPGYKVSKMIGLVIQKPDFMHIARPSISTSLIT